MAFSAATSIATEHRRPLQVGLLAVAHFAGAKPVGDRDELDLGNEIGHLDQDGAFSLAGFDALIAAE